jgi:L-asparagine transporter-like permease
MWMTTALAEITAVGLYVRYFAPDLPQWVPALGAVVFIVAANLVSARMFGLTESWFALIKIVAIVAFILSGIAILVFGVGDLESAAVSNLWDRGGFFPKGVLGPLIALQIVTYAFLGVEMIGVTAGEAKEPRRDLPLAINRVIWRILLFYVGAIAVVLMLVPWNELQPNESPFVVAWEALGIDGAAAILSGVVICSALSSCNTGVFTSSRMLWAMAGSGEAPGALRHVSRARVPRRALAVCGVVLLLGVAINAVIPEDAFTYITSIATVAVLWVWGMIAVIHLRFRASVRAGELPASDFRMPGAPWTNVLILAYVALIVVMLAYEPDQRIALLAGAVAAVGLVVGWRWVRCARGRLHDSSST